MWLQHFFKAAIIKMGYYWCQDTDQCNSRHPEIRLIKRTDFQRSCKMHFSAEKIISTNGAGSFYMPTPINKKPLQSIPCTAPYTKIKPKSVISINVLNSI